MQTRTFSPAVRKAVARIYNHTCASCGAEVFGPDAHIDHVDSFANGGKTEHGNAQLLCAPCNLKKSKASGEHIAFAVNKPVLGITLRPWQTECLQAQLAAIDNGSTEFFVAAGVGSGKTVQALSLYTRGDFDMVIIVTTKSGIRGSWSKDAKAMGLKLVPIMQASDFAGNGPTRELPNGYILNVHMVPSLMNDVMVLCSRFKVLLVLDEAHHYGEYLGWTNTVDVAFDKANFTLGLSGTPYRGDGQRIRCLTYTKKGRRAVSEPDYIRSYEDALAAGEVAPIVTRFVGGTVTKRHSNGRVEVYDYADADYSSVAGVPSPSLMSTRLRLSAVESFDWQMAAIAEARKDITGFGETKEHWGGLICCSTIDQAKGISNRIKARWGDKSMLIIDDAKTEDAVNAFIDDTSYRWAISISKISEGISINRLRVGVLLSTTTTRGNFEQIRGRLIRLMNGVSQVAQTAIFYIPADPRLIDFAMDSNRMVLHSVPWLNLRNEDAEDAEAIEKVYRDSVEDSLTGLDGAIVERGHTTANDIMELRQRLEEMSPGKVIDAGDYSLYANPSMDGAALGDEFISEEAFNAIREELAKVIHPITAMRMSGKDLEALKSMFSEVA
jgi:superfamily II DNA or RNA helicase